jgi:hypothetical protein
VTNLKLTHITRGWQAYIKIKYNKDYPAGTKLYRCRQHDFKTKITEFNEITAPPNKKQFIQIGLALQEYQCFILLLILIQQF